MVAQAHLEFLPDKNVNKHGEKESKRHGVDTSAGATTHTTAKLELNSSASRHRWLLPDG